MSEPIRGSGTIVSIRTPTPEQVLEMERLLIPLQRGQLVRLPDAMRIIAAERIPPGLSIAFDAAGRAFRWQPVEPLHFADEAIEPGDVLTVLPDGRVRLADRAAAVRRAEASPVDRRDGSPIGAGDGADAAIVARGKP